MYVLRNKSYLTRKQKKELIIKQCPHIQVKKFRLTKKKHVSTYEVPEPQPPKAATIMRCLRSKNG